jgi:hypothetical protein
MSAHAFVPLPFQNRLRTSKIYYQDERQDLQIAEASNLLEADMEQLTKPRPYPLLVAEQFASILDGAIDGLVTKSSAESGNNNDDSAAKTTKTKEHIVVLGSGWGSASFISELNPDLYDITVISPRNHFIFTPMLAGASVGSVEYRSICQPIREVSSR